MAGRMAANTRLKSTDPCTEPSAAEAPKCNSPISMGVSTSVELALLANALAVQTYPYGAGWHSAPRKVHSSLLNEQNAVVVFGPVVDHFFHLQASGSQFLDQNFLRNAMAAAVGRDAFHGFKP